MKPDRNLPQVDRNTMKALHKFLKVDCIITKADRILLQSLHNLMQADRTFVQAKITIKMSIR